MNKIFLLLIAVLLLVGCKVTELEDGYQVGDITHLAIREEGEIKQAVHDYCDKAADSIIRAAALRIIRLEYPFIPENGICIK